jgi:hypothetical protein
LEQLRGVGGEDGGEVLLRLVGFDGDVVPA